MRPTRQRIPRSQPSFQAGPAPPPHRHRLRQFRSPFPQCQRARLHPVPLLHRPLCRRKRHRTRRPPRPQFHPCPRPPIDDSTSLFQPAHPVFSRDDFLLDHFDLGQSPIVVSPSVPVAPFTPAPPALASAYSANPVNASDSATNIAPASSAPATTLLPMPVTTTSPTPIPAPVTESPNTQQAATPKASAAKVSNSTPVESASFNSVPAPVGPQPVSSTGADPAATEGSATLHTAPVVTLSPNATTVTAQTASASETGFAIANGTSNDDPAPLTPNLAPNSRTSAPMAAPFAASTHDAPSNGRPGVSPQPVSAAAPATAAGDKKSSAAMQPDLRQRTTRHPPSPPEEIPRLR